MGKSLGNYLKSGSHPSLLVRDTGNYSEVRSQSVFFYDQKRTVSCKKKRGILLHCIYCVHLDYFHIRTWFYCQHWKPCPKKQVSFWFYILSQMTTELEQLCCQFHYCFRRWPAAQQCLVLQISIFEMQLFLRQSDKNFFTQKVQMISLYQIYCISFSFFFYWQWHIPLIFQ